MNLGFFDLFDYNYFCNTEYHELVCNDEYHDVWRVCSGYLVIIMKIDAFDYYKKEETYIPRGSYKRVNKNSKEKLWVLIKDITDEFGEQFKKGDVFWNNKHIKKTEDKTKWLICTKKSYDNNYLPYDYYIRIIKDINYILDQYK